MAKQDNNDVTKSRPLFHVVLSSDSLSFPRPWNQKDMDANPEQFFRFETTYPHLLRLRLEEKMLERVVCVSNMGRRAVTVSNLKNVMRDLLSWMQADAVILHHGIVDCWIRNVETGETRTTPEDFDAILSDFMALRREIAPELPLIIIEIADTNARMLEKVPEQNDVIIKYNAILRKHAQNESGVMFLDYSDVSDDRSVIHEDGRHLSQFGHTYLADHIASLILKSACKKQVDAA